MDDLIIESTGDLEFYTNVDDLNLNDTKLVEAVPDSTYYVYQSVPEEIEDYQDENQTQTDNTENAKIEKEDIVENPEEKEEEKEDVEQSIKNDVVFINNVKRDILDNDSIGLSSNIVQNIINTPLNDYSLSDSLNVFTIVLVIGVLFYLLVKRTVFKWN